MIQQTTYDPLFSSPALFRKNLPWHEQYQISEKLLHSSWGGGWARVAVHMHFAPGGKLDPDRTQVELNQKTNLNHIGREVLSLSPPCISQIWHHCWWNAITTCGKINYFVILQSKMQIFWRKHTGQQHSSICTLYSQYKPVLSWSCIKIYSIITSHMYCELTCSI